MLLRSVTVIFLWQSKMLLGGQRIAKEIDG